MAKPRIKLKRMTLKGFKSFGEKQTLEFKDETLLIGANGSGKSNIISFFNMLNYMNEAEFNSYVEQQGGANIILYYSAKKTQFIEFEIEFETGNKSKLENITYLAKVSYKLPDNLFIAKPIYIIEQDGKVNTLDINKLPVDEAEKSSLRKDFSDVAKNIDMLIHNWRVFQFSDTSKESRIRQAGYIMDNKGLKSEGGNLAAFLYSIKQKEPQYYDRIVNQIRAIFPQFGDFELQPLRLNENMIMLNWYETNSDYLFGPHQLSDGTLRFIALTTLLLQPEETRPSVIFIDEPELGLHPAAITALAGMVHTISPYCQVFLATQSAQLLNHFKPNSIMVVERDRQKKYSVIKQLSEKELRVWLKKYTLAELWDKNVLGGRP